MKELDELQKALELSLAKERSLTKLLLETLSFQRRPEKMGDFYVTIIPRTHWKDSLTIMRTREFKKYVLGEAFSQKGSVFRQSLEVPVDLKKRLTELVEHDDDESRYVDVLPMALDVVGQFLMAKEHGLRKAIEDVVRSQREQWLDEYKDDVLTHGMIRGIFNELESRFEQVFGRAFDPSSEKTEPKNEGKK